ATSNRRSIRDPAVEKDRSPGSLSEHRDRPAMALRRPPRGRAQSPGRDHRARPGRRRATHARAATEASRFGATRRAEGCRVLAPRHVQSSRRGRVPPPGRPFRRRPQPPAFRSRWTTPTPLTALSRWEIETYTVQPSPSVKSLTLPTGRFRCKPKTATSRVVFRLRPQQTGRRRGRVVLESDREMVWCHLLVACPI